MSEALYERYKEALRRGHVAAERGRHDAALEAYGEAARIAPDRSLPFVGVARVLTTLGRSADALNAYDTALERAPGDETALRGRADLLIAAGDRVRAADALDRLATVLDGTGRVADATDAASRALELAESRGRRDTVRALADRLAGDTTLTAEASAASTLAAARRLLAGPATAPEEPPPPEPPPFFGGPATDAVEVAVWAGDLDAARDHALDAAAGHRAAGATAAAVDACYLALQGRPADAGLHLALAELYLDRGWRAIAADKLLLLARLAELTDDAATGERVCSIAGARLPDDPRLAERCA